MKGHVSPKDLAKAIGVSESTVKRWVDDGLIDAGRTAGGHRRIPLPEALRFIRRSRSTVIRPDLLGMPELSGALEQLWQMDSGDEALFEALAQGEAAQARGLIMAAYLTGQGAAGICDGPIHAALQRIGELWQREPTGIFVEHRAVDIAIQCLMQLRLSLPTPEAHAPTAVGAAPAGDPYFIPTLMAATVMADLGYQEVNLGPDTPLDSLLHAVQHHRARVVWLSMTAQEAARGAMEEVPFIADILGRNNTHLVLGGRMVHARMASSMPPNVHVAISMSELAAFAKGLLG